MARQTTLEPLRKIPQHVAIIMDGNGRWATSRGLPRLAGHRAGTENLRTIIRACVEFGIRHLTIYSFSTENWTRPQEEVEGLLAILEDVIERELGELQKEGVRLRHIGHLDRLPPALQKKINAAMEMTRDNQRLFLNIAFNYGGRDEILSAIRQIVASGVRPEQVTAELVDQHLFTAGTPDPDLIIRTSGEMRTSNFLVWQSVYTEWFFTPTYWPDFNREELHKALVEYGRRDRRYGGVHSNGSDIG